MKVLHVAEVGLGGVITVMDGLIAGQAALPAVEKVIRLCPGEMVCGPHPKIQEIRYRRTGRDMRSQLLLAFHLVRILLRERVDVLHLHSTFAGLWGRLLAGTLLRTRCSVTVYTPHGFSFLAPTPLREVYGWIEKVLARLGDCIVCVSQHEREAALLHGLPSHKLHVIRNGVAVQPDCRKSAGRRLRVLFVGRFDRQKGFDVLQAALARVADRESLAVRAVGAADRDRGNEFDQGCGIERLGWLHASELRAQYEWADVVVVPSRWEGFALVPLEAMSFGCAVVASDCCSMGEAVEDAVHGRLFPPGDDQALARILTEHSPAWFRTLGQAGLRRQRREFMLSLVIESTQALYGNLLVRGSVPKARPSPGDA